MEDSGMMNQASQIWSMLDDMAENNPNAYRKFIDKNLKEGREFNAAPKPHMCIKTCIVSSKAEMFVNVCSWTRITKPKDDCSPIPVFGSKLLKQQDCTKEDYFTVHVAFHPEVLDQFGKGCTSKQEQDMLIHLALSYLEDQHAIKLSRHYDVIDCEFKGSNEKIREDFGLGKDPLKEQMEKLAQSFAPVADIATKEPELVDGLSQGDIRCSNGAGGSHTKSNITIPGMSSESTPATNTKLIEEVKRAPVYTLSHQKDDTGRKIIIKVNLDDVSSVEQCTLDIMESSLTLEALDYYLHLKLPENINEKEVRAKFSKTRHQLIVTLPTSSP